MRPALLGSQFKALQQHVARKPQDGGALNAYGARPADPNRSSPLKLNPLALAVLLLATGAQAQQEVESQQSQPPQARAVNWNGSRCAVAVPMRPNCAGAPLWPSRLYGREELDKYGDTQLSDVLKRLPGINVQGGALRMRGLGGAFTQILVNGEPAPPGFNLEQISPAQVERVEVSKAPTADQSAQAIAGTVNIILKDAPRVVAEGPAPGSELQPRQACRSTAASPMATARAGWASCCRCSSGNGGSRNETSSERLGRDALGRMAAAPEHRRL